MLQIIGWIGCSLLVGKGLQLLQVSLDQGTASGAKLVGYLGFIGCVGASLMFLIMINQQASGVASPLVSREDDSRRAVRALGGESGALDRQLNAMGSPR